MDQRPLILFDGECNFCSRSVRFILRHERGPFFEFGRQQSPVGSKLLAARGLPAQPETMVVLDRHHIYTQSDGIIFILRQLRWPWSMIGNVMRLFPRPLRDSIYRFIARRRYALFGRAKDCPILPMATQHRFID